MVSISNLPEMALREKSTAPEKPFCNQSFRIARVLVNDFVHGYTGVFFDTIAPICKLFNSCWAKYFNFKSVHHFSRADHTFKFYKYGNRVIDFSVNQITNFKTPSTEPKSELEALQKTYSLQNMNWQSSYGYSVNQNDLKQLDINDGCCAGMSAHFILCYLKEIQAGKSPLEAVRKISPLYANGAPVSAQLAQIYHRTNTSIPQMLKQKKKEFIEEVEQITEQDFSFVTFVVCYLKSMFAYVVNTVCAWFGCSQLIVTEDQFSKIKSRLNNLEIKFNEFLDQLDCNSSDLEIMGLLVDKKFHYEADKMKMDDTGEGVEQVIQGLQKGIYQISLKPTDKSKDGHAVVFIKTDGPNHFLFDPNYATISLLPLESGKEIRKIAEHYYPKLKGSCSIIFRHCQLRNPAENA